MKRTLLSICTVAAIASATSAQTFTPAPGSTLAAGAVGTAYSGQTINAAIPTTITLSGEDLLAALPAGVAAVAGSAIDPSASYPITVSSTVLSVTGLPGGLTSDCNNCTVNGGSNRDIMISGTPTEGGTFVIDILSETAGEATIGGFTIPFGGNFDPGIGFPIPVPTLPGVMNAEGYTMNVSGQGNSIAEANEVFSLGFYPNPTAGDAILDVTSREGGLAAVEVYSITGSVVRTFTRPINVGVNRVSIDLNGVPAGIYLIKADINGAQALIRTQKI